MLLSGCLSQAHAEDGAVEMRLQRLEDLEALHATTSCYGRGLDAIAIQWRNPTEAIAEGDEIFAECWDEDVAVRVFTLGNPEPAFQFARREDWVRAVAAFFHDMRQYNNTRHLVSNVSIRLDGDRARVTSYAIIPHFFRVAGPQAPETATPAAVETQIARYEDEALRGEDGVWRIVRRDVFLEEILISGGFFPGGNGVPLQTF